MFDKSSKSLFYESFRKYYVDSILKNSCPGRSDTYLFYYDDDKNDTSCHWYFEARCEEELFYMILFRYCDGYLCNLAIDWNNFELMNPIESVKAKLLDTKFYYLKETEPPIVMKFGI